jgi:hypothetical protein
VLVRRALFPARDSLARRRDPDDTCRNRVGPPPPDRGREHERHEDPHREASIEERHRRFSTERFTPHCMRRLPLEHREPEHDARGHRQVRDPDRRSRRTAAEHEAPRAGCQQVRAEHHERDCDEAQGAVRAVIVDVGTRVVQVPDHDGRREHLDERIESEGDQRQ